MNFHGTWTSAICVMSMVVPKTFIWLVCDNNIECLFAVAIYFLILFYQYIITMFSFLLSVFGTLALVIFVVPMLMLLQHLENYYIQVL